MKTILGILLLTCATGLNASAFILQDGVSTTLYKPSSKAGVLDKTFGASKNGKITTTFSDGASQAYAVAIQPDGKIVVAGLGAYMVVARYNVDGSLDGGFGVGTGYTVDAIGSSTDYIFAIALQSDGKIVVAGHSSNGSNDDFSLARYTAAGELDLTFGSSTGKVITTIGSGNERAYALAIQPDGKIVLAGYSYNGSNNDFALARYTTDGDLDLTFGSDGNGKVTTAIGSGAAEINSMVLQSDGKIVVAGYGTSGTQDFALARYTSDGSLDTTFGIAGKVTTDFASGHDRIRKIALQSDGKIVAVGYANGGNDFALARYTTDIDPLIQSASLFVNGRGGLVR